MGEILSYKTNEYTLFYEIVSTRPDEKDGVVLINGCKGLGSYIAIPETINVDGVEKKVKYIGKKSFLGNSNIRRVDIPKNCYFVDDFAFAQCPKLATVVIRRNEGQDISIFGRKVFEECTALRDICIGDYKRDSLSALLATIPVRLYDEHLLTDNLLGTDTWFQKWDDKLRTFLMEEDVAGYSDLALCGEEDIKSDETEFMSDKRMQKCALCLLRLMNTECLEEADKQTFTDYLLAHSKGKKTDEAWKVILRDFGDDLEYYKLFADIGGITEENIDAMLIDIGERHAEAKAYLMNFKKENQSADFFDSFSL